MEVWRKHQNCGRLQLINTWNCRDPNKFFFQGHLETIFDCKFSPSNPNHLATASFDGTIKVWDIMTMQTVRVGRCLVLQSVMGEGERPSVCILACHGLTFFQMCVCVCVCVCVRERECERETERVCVCVRDPVHFCNFLLFVWEACKARCAHPAWVRYCAIKIHLLLLLLLLLSVPTYIVLHLLLCRPDMIFTVDWALNNNYLSIYYSIFWQTCLWLLFLLCAYHFRTSLALTS